MIPLSLSATGFGVLAGTKKPPRRSPRSGETGLPRPSARLGTPRPFRRGHHEAFHLAVDDQRHRRRQRHHRGSVCCRAGWQRLRRAGERDMIEPHARERSEQVSPTMRNGARAGEP